MQFILGGLVGRYYPAPALAPAPANPRRPSGSVSGSTMAMPTPMPMPPRSVRSTRAQEREPPGLGLGKYLAEILLYLVAFVAANMVWVFAWAFLDDHLLTWSYELSNWSCVLVALPLMLSLNIASTEVNTQQRQRAIPTHRLPTSPI